MRNLSCILIIMAALALTASAQPKPEDKKATPPAKVEFTPEQAKEAQAARDKARLASLEAENLALKIEQAQAAYAKLKDEAAKSSGDYVEFLRATAERHGIPRANLTDYEFSDANGKIVFSRKAEAVAKK